MTFEFDHLFICTDVGAGVADRLASLGLLEGSANSHPGQGSANRRFFFHNAKLELLWVTDPVEAQSKVIQRTHLWERWERRWDGACPFGFCLRPAQDSVGSVAFSHWDFHPPYLPQTLSIAVGTNSEVSTDPLLFQTPMGQRPDQFPAAKSQPLNHPVGWREITRVELVSPHAADPSPELQAVIDTHQINLRWGSEYWVELGFDGEKQGKYADLRPDLPLIVSG